MRRFLLDTNILLGLARKADWARQTYLRFNLGDPDVSGGKDVAAPRGTRPPKPTVPMGKNDLWIAATAHASGAILLSTDGDFEHLDGILLKYKKIDQTAGLERDQITPSSPPAAPSAPPSPA